jgi:tellurite resistance protein
MNEPTDLSGDLILKAMIAVAAADGSLAASEAGVIQKIYQDETGKPIGSDEIAKAAEGTGRAMLLADLRAASPMLDQRSKEGIIKAAYLALLADDRIAGEERKKLYDIAAALKVPEIHFGMILEDLAVSLAARGS